MPLKSLIHHQHYEIPNLSDYLVLIFDLFQTFASNQKGSCETHAETILIVCIVRHIGLPKYSSGLRRSHLKVTFSNITININIEYIIIEFFRVGHFFHELFENVLHLIYPIVPYHHFNLVNRKLLHLSLQPVYSFFVRAI